MASKSKLIKLVIATLLLGVTTSALADPFSLIAAAVLASGVTYATYYALAIAVVGTLVNGMSARRKAKRAAQAAVDEYNSKLKDRGQSYLSEEMPLTTIYGEPGYIGGAIVGVFKHGAKDEYKSVVYVFANHPCDAFLGLRIGGEDSGTISRSGYVIDGQFADNREDSVSQYLDFDANGKAYVPFEITGQCFVHRNYDEEPGLVLIGGGSGQEGEIVDPPSRFFDATTAFDPDAYVGTITCPDAANSRRYVSMSVIGQSRLHVSVHINGDGVADNFLRSKVPNEWTADHKLTGMTYIVVTMDLRFAKFTSMPNITASFRGKRIFDLRDGVTRYSRNPALQLADYLMADVGYATPGDAIDPASLIVAANQCDAQVFNPQYIDGYNFGNSTALYTGDGVVTTAQDREAIRESIESAMAGSSYESAGVWIINAGSWTAPVMNLQASDMLGPVQVVQTAAAGGDRINSMRIAYTNAYANGVAMDASPYRNGNLINLDGGERWSDITLAFTSSQWRATQLARIKTELSRGGMIINVTPKFVFWKLRPGVRIVVNEPSLGIVNKLFRVTDWTHEPGQPLQFQAEEDAPEFYDFADLTTVDPTPNTELADGFRVPVAPQGLTFTSGEATILFNGNSTTPRGLLKWLPSGEVFVEQNGTVEVQWKRDTESLSDWKPTLLPGNATQLFLLSPPLGALLNFRVRFKTDRGTPSAWTAIDGQAEGLPVVFQPAGDLTVELHEDGIYASWADLEGIYGIALEASQVREGASWETGRILYTGKERAINVGWMASGTRTLWVAHRSYNGPWSVPASAQITILVPGQPILTAVDGYKSTTLQWEDVRTTQPLGYYEVRRGELNDTEASSVVVSQQLSQLITVSEPEEGDYRYWVKAYDKAGNAGASGYITVTVLGFGIQSGPNWPVDPKDGDQWYNTTLKQLGLWSDAENRWKVPGVQSGDTLPPVNEPSLREGDSYFLNGELYNFHNGAWEKTTFGVDQIESGAIDITKFADGIEPVSIVDALPAVKTTAVVVLTTDGKAYRWDGNAYTKAVPTADLSGTINAGQIAANAIDQTKIANGLQLIVSSAGVPSAYAGPTVYNSVDGKLYNWNGNAYTKTVATVDLVGTISAGQIAAGAVDSSKVAGNLQFVEIVSSLPTSKIANVDSVLFNGKLYTWTGTAYSNAVSSGQIEPGSIDQSKFVPGLTAVVVVNSLPGTYVGDVVFNKGDSKQYRWNGVSYVSSVATVDLTGVITAAQIAAQAIDLTKLASGIQPTVTVTAVPGAKIENVNTVYNTTDGKLYTWNGAIYAREFETSALIGQVTGAQIAAQAIDLTKLADALSMVKNVNGVPSVYQGTTVIYDNATQKLYRWNGSSYVASVATVDLVGTISAAQIAAQAIDLSKLAAGIEPTYVVTGVPGAKITNVNTVYNTVDGKLYTWDGAKYSAAVLASDVTGQLVAAQIAAGQITLEKFQVGLEPVLNIAGVPSNTYLGATSVWSQANGKMYRWDGAKYVYTVPTVDLTGTISAGQIDAGAIDRSKIAAGLEVITITTGVPTNYAGSATIYNQQDGKLYTWTGVAYSKSVPTTDLVGQVTAAQIAAGAIDTSKLVAGLEPITVVASVPNGYIGTAAVYNTGDSSLYAWNGTAYAKKVNTIDLVGTISAAQLAAGSVDITKFASGIEPITTVTSVPGSKITSVIFNQTDGKQYRWTAGGYVATVPTVDLVGTISSVQIAAGAVDLSKLANGLSAVMNVNGVPNAYQGTTVIYDNFTQKLYRWNGTAYVTTVPTTDLAGTINAGQIEAASIDLTKLATGLSLVKNVNGVPATYQDTTVIYDNQTQKLYRWNGAAYVANVATVDLQGTISTAQIAAGAIDATKLAAGMEAVTIRSGVPSAYVNYMTTFYNTADGKLYRWNGNAYTAATLSTDISGLLTSAQIESIAALKIVGQITTTQIGDNSISTAKLQVGAVTADVIAANAITVGKLAIGDFENLIQNGTGKTTDGWSGDVNSSTGWNATWWAQYGSGSDSALTVHSRDSFYGAEFNVKTGDEFYVRMLGVPEGGAYPAHQVGLGLVIMNDAGQVLTYDRYIASGAEIYGSREMVGPGKILVNGAARARVWLQVNGPFGGIGPGQGWHLTDLEMRRKNRGNLIVDGAITANLVAANAISADAIQANAIVAGKIAAGAISAREIQAGAITADKLNVLATGDNIIQNPSFEQGLVGWTLKHNQNSGGGFVAEDAGNSAFEGRFVATLTKSQSSDRVCMSSRAVPVTPGEQYLFRMRYRVVGAATVVILGLGFNGSQPADGYIGYPDAAYWFDRGVLNVARGPAANDSWLLHEAVVTVPPGCNWMSAAAHNWGPDWNGPSYLQIDAVEFRKQVVSANIADGAITTPKLVANAVVADKIAANAISSDKLQANSVTAGKVAADAITAGTIAAGAIRAREIAAGAVTADKLLVSSVGAALNDDPAFADTSTWYNDQGGIYYTDTTDGPAGLRAANSGPNGAFITCRAFPIQAGKQYSVSAWLRAFNGHTGVAYLRMIRLGNNGEVGYFTDLEGVVIPDNSGWFKFQRTITAEPGANHAVLHAYLNWQAPVAGGNMQLMDYRCEEVIGSTLIQDGAITTDKVAANAIVAGKVAANAINADNIQAGAIVAGKIAADAITAGTVAAGAINTRELAANSIDVYKLQANSVIAEKIAAGSIYTDKIVAGAVTVDKLSANSVSTDKLQANAVTAGKVAADAITAGTIAANAISSREIAAGAITAEKLNVVAIGDNLILNGGFEDDFTNWSTTAYASNLAVFAIEGGLEGYKSATIARNEANWHGCLISKAVPVEPNAWYVLRFKYAVVGGATNFLPYIFQHPTDGGGYIPYPGAQYFDLLPDNGYKPGNAGWQTYEQVFQVRPDVAFLSLAIHHWEGVWEGPTFLRLDAFSMRKQVTSATIANGAVTADKIVAGAITAGKIAANSISADKMQANSVSADALQANAVTAGKVAANAITAGTIAAGAVSASSLTIGATRMQRLSVMGTANAGPSAGYPAGVYLDGVNSTTSATRGLNVAAYDRTTHAKVFDRNYDTFGDVNGWGHNLAVDLATLNPGHLVCVWSVDAFYVSEECALALINIGASAAIRIAGFRRPFSLIGYPALGEGNGLEKLHDVGGPVAEVSAMWIDADVQGLGGGVTAYTQIGNTKIVDGAITTGKIAANAITAGTIAANAVTVDKLAANSVSTDKLQANAVVAGKIAADAITAGTIAAGAISAREIQAGVITFDKMAAGFGTNIVPNSTFVSNNGSLATGWTEGLTHPFTNYYTGFNQGFYHPGDDLAMLMHQNDEQFAGADWNFCYHAFQSKLVACVPGQRYEASVYSGAHRCTLFIAILFFDANGALVGNISGQNNNQEQAGGPSLGSWKRIGVMASAPLDGINVRVELRKGPTFPGTGDSWAMWTKPMIAQASANQTQYSDWNPTGLFTTITAEGLATGAVIADRIAAGAVIADKIAVNSIAADKLQANSVSADKIQANAVTAGKIAADAITAGTIQAGAITTDKLAANAVTAAKLQIGNFDNLVVDGNMQDVAYWGRTVNDATPNYWGIQQTWDSLGSMYLFGGNFDTYAQMIPVERGATYLFKGQVGLQNGFTGNAYVFMHIPGITYLMLCSLENRGDGFYPFEFTYQIPQNVVSIQFRIARNSGTSGNMEIGGFKVIRVNDSTTIKDGAITTDKVAANAIVAGKIAANAVSADTIQAGAITAGKIAADAVTAGTVSAGAINTRELASGSITADKMTVNSVYGSSIVGGSITADKMTVNSIYGDAIVANAISADKIQANAVTAGKIAADAVTAGTIAAGAITAREIAAGAISASKVTIVDLENLINNGGESADGWGGSIIVADYNAPNFNNSWWKPLGESSNVILALEHRDAYYGNRVPVKNGDQFWGKLVTVPYGGGASLAPMSLGLLVADAAGNPIYWHVLAQRGVGVVGGNVITGVGTINSVDAAYVTVWLTVQDTEENIQAGPMGRKFYFIKPEIRRVNKGELIVDGAITTNKLTASAVTTDKLQANAVTVDKLAANSVSTDKLQANAVVAGKIAADAVTAGTVAASAINTRELAANSIDVYKLQANAVTAEKIAAGSIYTEKLVAGAVTADKVAANAISADSIQANAITAGKVAAGAIAASSLQIGASAITRLRLIGTGAGTPVGDTPGLYINGVLQYGSGPRGLNCVVYLRSSRSPYYAATYDTYGSEQAKNDLAGYLSGLGPDALVFLWSVDAIGWNQALVDAVMRVGGSAAIGGLTYRHNYALIGTAGIGEGNGLEQIHDQYTTPADISTLWIDNDIQGLNSGVNTYTQINNTKITDGAISTGKIQANAVTVDKLSANSVSTDKLQANAVVAGKIAADAITAGTIAAGAITARELAVGSVTAEKLSVVQQEPSLIFNPSFEEGVVGWSFTSHSQNTGPWQHATGGTDGTYCIWLGRTQSDHRVCVVSKAVAVTPGAMYTLRFKYLINAGAGVRAHFLPYVFQHPSLPAEGFIPYPGALYTDPLEGGGLVMQTGGAWVTYETVFSIRADCHFLSLAIHNWDGVWDGPVFLHLDEFSFRKQITSAFIADGQISTPKLVASAVTTDKIAAGAVVANTIAANAISADKLQANSVTAGKVAADAITAGTIAANAISAREIAAGAITADKLLVSSVGAALNDDPSFGDTSTWYYLAGSAMYYTNTTDGPAGLRAANAGINGAAIASRAFTIQAGKQYSVSAWLRAFGGHVGVAYLRLIRAGNNGEVGGYTGLEAVAVPDNGTWMKVQYTITAEAGANYGILHAYLNWVNGNGGTMQMMDYRCEEVIGSTLIQDGAINTFKLTANAVTAEKIASQSITADKMTVNSIYGDAIVANAITTGKIAAGAVTATQVAANAITAEKIAAGSITASKIAISDFENLVTNGTGKNLDGWSGNGSLSSDYDPQWTANWWSYVGEASDFSLTIRSRDTFYGPSFPVKAGDSFYAKFISVPTGAQSNLRDCGLGLCLLNAAGQVIDYVVIAYRPAGTVGLNNGVYKAEGSWTCTNTNVAGAVVWFQINGDPSEVGNVRIGMHTTNHEIRRMNGGKLIVDGAITADKITASAVTADKLAANSVVAGKVAANAITADNIQANAITAGKLASSSVETDKLAAGSVVADKIAANAVTAAKISAGAITADKINVGGSPNLLQNSGFAMGADYWNFGSNLGDVNVNRGVNLEGDTWHPPGLNTLVLNQTNNDYNGQDPNSRYCEYSSNAIASNAGSRYEFSFYAGCHRCTGYAVLAFYDSNNNIIGSGTSTYNVTELQGGKTFTSFKRVFGFATAPAGTASMRLFIRKGPTDPGQGNSYLFIVGPMLAEATVNQTELSPYVPSGLGVLITPSGISTPSLSALSANLGAISAGQLSINGNGSGGTGFARSGNKWYRDANWGWVFAAGPSENFMNMRAGSCEFYMNAAGAGDAGFYGPGFNLSNAGITISQANVIGTLQVQGEAITAVRYGQTPGNISIAGGWFGTVSIYGYDPQGGRVLLSFNAPIGTFTNNGPSDSEAAGGIAPTQFQIRILKNGNVIYQNYCGTSGQIDLGNHDGAANWQAQWTAGGSGFISNPSMILFTGKR